MSLIEIMVVITILGLIMAAVGVAVIPKLDEARRDTARLDIANLHNALKLYYAKKGKFPDTSTGLRALVETQTLEQMPKDPWGNDYVYLNERGKPVITAYGADGSPGGGHRGEPVAGGAAGRGIAMSPARGQGRCARVSGPTFLVRRWVMGRTIEIPRETWAVYFDNLSKRALNEPVRIEVENRDIGDQEMTRKLPLVGIDLDTKGSEAGAIEVSVGDERRELMHRIDNAVRVYLKIDDDGNIDCLEIEDQDDGKTLLFFEGSGVPAQFQPETRGFGESAPSP